MEDIQKLRSDTGAGVLDVKRALDEAEGNYEKAREILRKRGIAVAQKKAGRSANQGVIFSYVHQGRIGVLVELSCETDFVARTPEFQALAKDIAMHVAAMNPLYITSADVSAQVQEKEKEIYRAQVPEGKPPHVVDQIIDGKLQKYFHDMCLVNQPFYKNPDRSVQEVLHDAIGRMGENIRVRRFVRIILGEDFV